MKTASGATSIGAPHSAARYKEEALHAAENQPQLLFLTEEGRELIGRFAKSVGCDFSLMTNDDASNWLESELKALYCFLCGVNFCFSKI
jgi:hypothetical protein